MSELISVIIPAYNVGPYLDNCLSSVLHQSYPYIEIIVIDDGSTDNTLQIAENYQVAFPDKVYVVHTENHGVTMARFEGLQKAKGEWIGFVDGDDEIEPDMYERLYKNAKKYNADISHCGHKTIVNGGERIHDFYNTGRIVLQNKRTGLSDLLIGPVEPSLWTKLYRKRLVYDFLKDGSMDTSIKYNEDLLMNYYLFRDADKSIYEDFCGYHYLAHSSSVTRSTFRIRKVTDPVRVWRYILDDAEPNIRNYAWKRYLTASVNAYTCLAVHADYENESKTYRKILFDNRDRWKVLNRNTRIKLSLVLLSPKIYNRINNLYTKPTFSLVSNLHVSLLPLVTMYTHAKSLQPRLTLRP